MHILETMVANDPTGRVTVTFLGEGDEAVEVHMHGARADTPAQQLIEKAKVMLIHAASAGDGAQQTPDGPGELTAAPMPDEKRDPYASSPDDEGDNSYEAADQALPNDREEAALDRSMSREATRFDQIE